MKTRGSFDFLVRFGALVSLCGVVACEPVRNPFDVFTPETSSDAGSDTGSNPMDVTSDTGASCDDQICDETCITRGGVGGTCRVQGCVCFGLPIDGGTTDSGQFDTGAPDAPDANVTPCTSNTDCPPAMFCSATACTGPGYCQFRGVSDPAMCPASSPGPSCGCNGTLYPSVCARLSAGVRRAASTMCPATLDGGTSMDASTPQDASGGSDAADSGG